eukprot:scaffold17500_cov126-Isochrysis_galbana.AAC.7
MAAELRMSVADRSLAPPPLISCSPAPVLSSRRHTSCMHGARLDVRPRLEAQALALAQRRKRPQSIAAVAVSLYGPARGESRAPKPKCQMR